MSTNELQRKMRSVKWNANKRTMKDQERVSVEIVEKAQSILQLGKHDEAVKLLQAVDTDVLHRDYGALMVLGLGHFGLGQTDQALKYLDAADQVTKEMRARALLNKANVRKVKGDYTAATSDALQAVELAPKLSASHLMIFAIIENERPKNRAELLTQSVTYMKQVWDGWQNDQEFWGYLMTDVDYSKIRESGELEKLFGTPPLKFGKEQRA